MERRAVIVVCGTYFDWLQFQRCVPFTNRFVYVPLIHNNYNKLTGFKKYTTEVIRVGSWKESINVETEKFLELFEV